MISTNIEFFEVSNRGAMSSQSLSFALEIFSGTIPDDTAILDDAGVLHNNTFQIDAIRDAIPEDNTRLGVLAFEAAIKAEYIGSSKVVLPLSDSVRELLVEAEGTATWFMLYTSNISTTSEALANYSNIRGYQLIKGTVGAVESGADLEVPNSEVSFSRDFKCSDLTFNLV